MSRWTTFALTMYHPFPGVREGRRASKGWTCAQRACAAAIARGPPTLSRRARIVIALRDQWGDLQGGALRGSWSQMAHLHNGGGISPRSTRRLPRGNVPRQFGPRSQKWRSPRGGRQYSSCPVPSEKTPQMQKSAITVTGIGNTFDGIVGVRGVQCSVYRLCRLWTCPRRVSNARQIQRRAALWTFRGLLRPRGHELARPAL